MAFLKKKGFFFSRYVFFKYVLIYILTGQSHFHHRGTVSIQLLDLRACLPLFTTFKLYFVYQNIKCANKGNKIC